MISSTHRLLVNDINRFDVKNTMFYFAPLLYNVRSFPIAAIIFLLTYATNKRYFRFQKVSIYVTDKGL